MTLDSVRRKIEAACALLPPDAPPYNELPIEAWVEEIAGPIPGTTLRNTEDEAHFFSWLERLPKDLTLGLAIRFHEATTGLPWNPVDSFPDIGEELERRALGALPPLIETQWNLWQQHILDRERRRAFVEGEDWRSPHIKTHDNGWGWHLRAQEDYRRLARKYEGWPEEWREFYSSLGAGPMTDEQWDMLARVCFLREEAGDQR